MSWDLFYHNEQAFFKYVPHGRIRKLPYDYSNVFNSDMALTGMVSVNVMISALMDIIV